MSSKWSWSSQSAYIQYKNDCKNKTCETVNTQTSLTKPLALVSVNDCKWTNYADYLRYKNLRLIIQDNSTDIVGL